MQLKHAAYGLAVALVAVALTVVAVAAYSFHRIQRFNENAEQSKLAVRALDEEFAFTPRGDDAVDFKRFGLYLGVRDEVLAICDRQPAVAALMVAAGPDDHPVMDSTDWASYVDEMAVALPEVAEALRRDRMSFAEYHAHTVTALRILKAGIESGDSQLAGELRHIGFIDARVRRLLDAERDPSWVEPLSDVAAIKLTASQRETLVEALKSEERAAGLIYLEQKICRAALEMAD